MRHTTLAMIMLGLAIGLGGCQRTTSQSPLQTQYADEDITGNLDFWHGLSDRKIVTNNEMAHALIEFANETDPNETYEQRVAWLKEKKYLDGSFEAAGNASAQRGTIAQIICRICDIKGGLTMRIIGAHPRYALHELVDLNLIAPSSAQQGISGIEFVGLIGRAELHMENQL
jgi:hypothetical protein